MRKLAVLLILAGAQAALPAPAAVQSAATGPDITVTGENRIICRRVTRTATRMRVGRICRSQAQWSHESAPGVVASNPNATIDGAADTLEMLGEKVSTNSVGGMPGTSGGSGPY
jgi:hypothetical protein